MFMKGEIWGYNLLEFPLILGYVIRTPTKNDARRGNAKGGERMNGLTLSARVTGDEFLELRMLP